MQGNPILLFPVLLPFLAAFLAFLCGRGRLSRIVTAFSTAAVVCVALWLAMGYREEQSLALNTVYAFSLKLDGFRAIHIALTGLLFGITYLFSREYFIKAEGHYCRRYEVFTLLTLGAVMGVFLSANLLTLFIFFEVMSFTSYVWVVHDQSPEAKNAGQSYLGISVIAGMVMLMGLFLLNHTLGTLEISRLGEAVKAVGSEKILLPGVLILMGFGTKAGLYPLHVWMPKAYPAAPAPATALLSGILSKTGVYGVLVLSANAFLHDSQWGMLLLSLGVVTMLWGGICGLFSGDMKKILAYSSMSQIGFIFVGIGMQGLLGEENALAVRGTVLHMLNHSVVKLILFTLCGIVFMNLGTHKLGEIQGFARKKPAFALAFLGAAMAICGVPLFSGYISKTLLHESIVEYSRMAAGSALLFTGVEWLFLLSGGLTVAYMLKIGAALFSSKGKLPSVKKAYGSLTAACILAPAASLLLVGAFPGIFADTLADLGQGMMYGRSLAHPVTYFSLQNLAGAFTSILIGALLYFLFVRRVLVKRQGERVVYREPFPKWFNLEDSLYRPLLLKWIPLVLGAVCTFMDRYVLSSLYKTAMFLVDWYARITANLADGAVELLVLLGFKPAREKNIGGKRVSAAYKMGTLLDRTTAVFSKQPKKRASFAVSLAKYEEQSTVRRRMISASLSYGLLFAGVGLVIVLVYLMFS